MAPDLLGSPRTNETPHGGIPARLYRIDECYTVIAPLSMNLDDALDFVEALVDYTYTDEERAQMRQLAPEQVARFRVWLDAIGDERVTVADYLAREVKVGSHPPFLICTEV